MRFNLGLVAVAVAGGVATAIPYLIAVLFSDFDGRLMPTTWHYIAAGLLLLAALELRDDLKKTAGVLWVLWFFIGSLNGLASATILRSYYANLDFKASATIYLAATAFFLAGLAASPSQKFRAAERVRCDVGRLSRGVVLLFPVLWILSLYSSIGYIPILSGVDITEEIYTLQYGPLYPYTILLAISSLFVLSRVLQCEGRDRALWLVYYFAILLLSLADGKRVILVVSFLSAIPLLVSRLGAAKAFSLIGGGGVAALIMYSAALVFRAGGQLERYTVDLAAAFLLVGVEYRDFAYSVVNFTPGAVPGYSWLASAAAAMVNSSLLSLVGVDKGEAVSAGSAYVWSKLFASPYGIRTGVVSELWFAYEYFAWPLLFLFGWLVGLVIKKIRQSRRESGRIFLSFLYGSSLLSIFGQTTAILGSVTVVLYLMALVYFERWILNARHAAD